MSAQIPGTVQLASLRSLDDFILGSARFQLPNFNDLDKWGKRVLKNLLYYQTNYFLLFLAVYTLMVFMYPTKIVTGFILQAIIFALVITIFERRRRGGPNKGHSSDLQQFWSNLSNGNNVYYLLIGTVVVSYILMHWMDCICLCLLTFSLPLTLIFIHASMRLRNMKNKVVNTMDSFGPATPMSVLLEALNLTVEKVI